LVPTLDFGKIFEPASDFFLTDTILVNDSDQYAESQPVTGFVGITGQTCCWRTAADLVAASSIPVILAGGISPGNVTEGILQVRPQGVDSCTRTNFLDEKGAPVRFKKDIQKVKQMVEAVRKAEKAI
jgi:phosphoribosylanthranilate isomerase